MLSLLIWIPAASALIGAIAGGRRTPGALALLGSLGSLGIAIALVAGFNGHAGQLTHVIDVVWIRSLGVHYKLGLDGLNLFLVALTTFVFSLSLLAANRREWERPETLLPAARRRAVGRARRLPRPGPGAVHRLLRPDADPLLPADRHLRRRRTG